jgi:hypothetical protein
MQRNLILSGLVCFVVFILVAEDTVCVELLFVGKCGIDKVKVCSLSLKTNFLSRFLLNN